MIRFGYLMEPSAGPLMLCIEFSTNACSTPQPRDLHNSKPQRCSSHKVADPGPHVREWARPPAGARRDLLDKEAMPGDERISLEFSRESPSDQLAPESTHSIQTWASRWKTQNQKTTTMRSRCSFFEAPFTNEAIAEVLSTYQTMVRPLNNSGIAINVNGNIAASQSAMGCLPSTMSWEHKPQAASISSRNWRNLRTRAPDTGS